MNNIRSLFLLVLVFAIGTPVLAEDAQSDNEGVQRSQLAMALLMAARDDAELRAACAADLAACIQASGRNLPEYDMEYTAAEDGAQSFSFRGTNGAWVKASMDPSGEVGWSSEGGVETRRGGCTQSDFDWLVAKCWGTTGNPLPDRMLCSKGAPRCDCTTIRTWNTNYYPCHAEKPEDNACLETLAYVPCSSW